MRESLYDAIWSLGVRTLHFAKRTGLASLFEHVLLKIASRVIPPPSGEIEVTLPLGMRMVVPSRSLGARTYRAGLYEWEVTDVVKRILAEGMAVADVGAFCGYYTLLASRLIGPTGRVYAFEPQPENYAYLVRNAEANGCRNVVPVAKAVSKEKGSATLAIHHLADHHWLSSSPSNLTSVVVPTVSLDEFFATEGWPSIDLIKMDIEGGELAALEGSRELSRRNPKMQLVMEFDLHYVRRASATRDALVAILAQLDFTRGYIIEQGLKPFSIADAFPEFHSTYNLLLTKE